MIFETTNGKYEVRKRVGASVLILHELDTQRNGSSYGLLGYLPSERGVKVEDRNGNILLYRDRVDGLPGKYYFPDNDISKILVSIPELGMRAVARKLVDGSLDFVPFGTPDDILVTDEIRKLSE